MSTFYVVNIGQKAFLTAFWLVVSEKKINFALSNYVKSYLVMNAVKIAGVTLLAILWLWLCRSLVAYGGGFNLKNLFLIVASGIIIFVPLWKKYVRQSKNNH